VPPEHTCASRSAPTIASVSDSVSGRNLTALWGFSASAARSIANGGELPDLSAGGCDNAVAHPHRYIHD
jgi:hypothetical protein